MVNQITCEKCGKTIGDNQKFCPFCGAEVKQQKTTTGSTIYEFPTVEKKKKFPTKLVAIIGGAVVLLAFAVFFIINFNGNNGALVGENTANLYMLRKNVSDEQAVIYIEPGEESNKEQFKNANSTIIERIREFDPAAEIAQSENRITVKSDKSLYSEYGTEQNIFATDGTLGMVIDDYTQEEKKVYELDKTGVVSVEIGQVSGYALGEELLSYDIINDNVSMWSDVDMYIAEEQTVEFVKVTVNETEANKIKTVIETAKDSDSGVLAVSDCSDLTEMSNCWYGGTELGKLYPVPGSDFKEFYIITENITSVPTSNLVKKVIEGPVFEGIMRTDNSPMYYGFMDYDGNVVIELEYDYLREPTEGLIAAQKDGKWGCIDEKGNEVIQFEYDTVGGFHNGLAIVEKEDKWGVINSKGKLVIDYQYEDMCSFGDGFAPFKLNGKWGLIDEDGNVIVESQYEDAVIPYSGIVSVKKDGKWGGIDKTGKTVIQFDYDESFAFNEGEWAPVCKNGRYGYIDAAGNTVIPFEYTNASYFIEGMAAVEQHDKFGFINESGETVIPFIYEWAYPFVEGMACVTEDYEKDSYYIDKNGETVLKPGYEDVGQFIDGLALVNDDGIEFYINKQGEQVGPSFKVY